MTDAGWHPDPHGRADRRYHDGTGWTVHIADADGTTRRDPHGALATPQPPPAAPVIGPPPPRRSPAVSGATPADPSETDGPAASAAADDRITPGDPTGADGLAWADAPAPGPAASPSDTDRSQQPPPTTHATAPPPAQPTPGDPDHTPHPSATDQATATPPAQPRPGDPGPTDGADHTQPLSAADHAAAPAPAQPTPGDPAHTHHLSKADQATAPAPAQPTPRDPNHTHHPAAADHAATPPAQPTPGDPGPAGGADHTQQLSAADLAAATSSARLAKPAGETDHTVQMSPEEVAAAAALLSSPPPVEARQGPHTEPISTQDLTAAAAQVAAARDTATDERRRPRVGAVIGALAGIGLGVVGLLALEWGPGTSYLDIRRAIDRFGATTEGAATNAFLLTGALFAMGVGGIAALARVIGARPVRSIAAVVAVLGTAGLAVLGFAAIEVEGVRAASADVEAIGPQAGAPVTLPDGTPVTDPSTGSPVTVPEGGLDPGAMSDAAMDDVITAAAEDRLEDAAVVGAVVLVVAGVLLLVGLGLRGTAGHLVTLAGLLVSAGWAIVAVNDIRGVGDLGPGAYAVVAATILLAASAAVPGRRPNPTTP